MAAGRGSDASETVDLATVREAWGHCRYEPAGVDAADLMRAVDRYGSDPQVQELFADAVAELAASDPESLVDHVDALDGYLGAESLGRPAARALGHVARVDPETLSRLADHLARGRGHLVVDAATALRTAVEADPGAIADAADADVGAGAGVDGSGAPGPVAAAIAAGADALAPPGTAPSDAPGDADRRGSLPSPDRIGDAAAAALGALAAVDASVLDRLRTLLEDDDPGRRACGARAIGAAAAGGDAGAAEALSPVADLLDDRSTVRVAATNALAEAADAVPSPGGLVGTLLAVRSGAGAERAAHRALVRLARAQSTVFDALLEVVAGGDRRLSGLLGGALDWPDYDRAVRATAYSAGAHPGRLGDRPAAVDALFAADPVAGTLAVRNAARARPEPFGGAVDPLFERLHGFPGRIAYPGELFEALAALAPAHEAVPTRLVDRLADAPDGTLAATAATCRAVAERHPETLLAVGDDPGTPTVVRRLEDALTSPARPEAAEALARLGRYDGSTVDPLVSTVVEELREVEYGRPEWDWLSALYELAGVAVHVDPGAFGGVGESVVDWVDPDEADVATPFLSSYVAEFPQSAARLVDRLDDEAFERPVLEVLAVAAASDARVVTAHVERIARASTRRHWDVRRNAVRALATAAGDDPASVAPAAGRFVELAYDPEPTVRAWAAFGVGELLAAGATGGGVGDALDRLEAVATTDAARGGDQLPARAATLSLVRGGSWSPSDHLDRLADLAVEGDRPMARAAVDALARADEPDGALARVADRATDPRIRKQAERARRSAYDP